MMESSRFENIIKDIRNLFRLVKPRKGTNVIRTKGIRNLFTLKKGNKAIKSRIVTDMGIFLSMKKNIIINQ